jgi:hypothetical protein
MSFSELQVKNMKVNKMDKKAMWPSKWMLCFIILVALPVITQADTYSYDVTGRLTVVTYDDGSGISYTYDNAGSITNKTVLAAALDTDGDTVPDALDNCTLIANTDQRDTDGDNYGNMCDGDLNDDGIVNFFDFGLFKTHFGTIEPDADFNGDGIVNFFDFGLFKQMFGKQPGLSGLVP